MFLELMTTGQPNTLKIAANNVCKVMQTRKHYTGRLPSVCCIFFNIGKLALEYKYILLTYYSMEKFYTRWKPKRSLLNTIKKRKCQYFGHIIRGNGVQQMLMEGRINGRRGRGRPRTMWITSRNGQKYHIMTVSEWHKIENDGDPWQPTCWLQMAHNDDDDILA